jgi:hypothetical protein
VELSPLVNFCLLLGRFRRSEFIMNFMMPNRQGGAHSIIILTDFDGIEFSRSSRDIPSCIAELEPYLTEKVAVILVILL